MAVTISPDGKIMQENSGLLSPITLRGVTLPSRIVLSPMCQFSCTDGLANEWHILHLGSRAVGGAALVFTEATAVASEGRISPGDLGIWDDVHIDALKPVADTIARYGAVPGIQLAHAGRKAARNVPWAGNNPMTAEQGAWPIVGPSPVAFEDGGQTPNSLDELGINRIVEDFEQAALRAIAAGFRVIELHGAHGYLLHQFLSPVSNRRDDAYGGNLENRMRMPLRIVKRVRSVIPDDMPLVVRISATDWIDDEPSWTLDQAVEFARHLKMAGVDLVDASSGGLSLKQKLAIGPEYQVPFARRIRRETGILTSAVGLLTDPVAADAVIARGDADLIFVGRAFLENPYWGVAAHKMLGSQAPRPKPYGPHALRPPQPRPAAQKN